MVNEVVYSFSRSQLVWLLCEQHWLTLAASPMVLVGSLWFCPDKSWFPVAERGNTFAGCTARVSKEVWAVAGKSELNASQQAWRKECLSSWVFTEEEMGKCSETLPNSSPAFSPPWSLTLQKGSCPEQPQWLGIRVG